MWHKLAVTAALLSCNGSRQDEPCEHIETLEAVQGVEVHLLQDCGSASPCRLSRPSASARFVLGAPRCLDPDAHPEALLDGQRVTLTSGGSDVVSGGDTPGQRGHCSCADAVSQQVELGNVEDGVTLSAPSLELAWRVPNAFLQLSLPDGQPARAGEVVSVAFAPAPDASQQVLVQIEFERTDGTVSSVDLYPVDGRADAQDFAIPATGATIKPGRHRASARLLSRHRGCEGLGDCSQLIDLTTSFEVQVD